MKARVLYIKEVDSTNNYLRHCTAEAGEMVVAWTDFQTAGRGCGTNTWESEAGKNLTFSMLFCPEGVAAREQFILSMASAVALKRVLDRYTAEICIKWPNDIYWADRKICGTLIETTLSEKSVKTCIVGTGMNVNQQLFRSDAPNPVSLCQILGHEVDREALLEQLIGATVTYMNKVEHGEWEELRRDYRAALYRRGEVHDYRMPDGTTTALILTDVEDDGHLLLTPPDGGSPLRFGFKEVQFVI
jgi:BirA family biotin operon repressor/biotin-[acetyl-CoA-carboxylase] ligase